jgi:putative selenate reductase molybdopterin-binding subunit
VDDETGEIKVLKIVVAPLTTTVINPVTHQGQINGAFVQGLGYALMEELRSDEGRISTLSFADYKIPNIMDIPPLVTALVPGSKSTGPFNSHPISESGLAGVAPAIANAIFDAMGVRIVDLPLTAEKIHRAIKQMR